MVSPRTTQGRVTTLRLNTQAKHGGPCWIETSGFYLGISLGPQVAFAGNKGLVDSKAINVLEILIITAEI